MKKKIIGTILAVFMPALIFAATQYFPDVIVKGSPWYDIRGYTTLGAAVTAVGASGKTMLVLGNVAVSASTDISSIPLWFLGSGKFTVAAGQALTVGSITAGTHTIFAGAGTIVPTNYAVKAEWFSSLATAITMLAATECEVEVGTNQSIIANMGNPATMSLSFVGTGRLTIDNGISFTALGPIKAVTNRQIFYGNGAFVPPSGQSIYCDWWPSFAKAVADIAANARILTVTSAKTISGNMSIPVTLSVIVNSLGTLNPAGAVTLTINGQFSAEPKQVFGGSGTIVFGGYQTVYPDWWLSNTIPGTTVMTVALQAAFNSGAKKIKGVPGAIYLTAQLGIFTGNMEVEDLYLKCSAQYAGVTTAAVTLATFSGTVHFRNIEVDFGGFGNHGIYISGDYSTVNNYYAHDMIAINHNDGYAAGLVVSGDYSVLNNIRGKDLSKGTNVYTSGRVLNLSGPSTGIRVNGLYGSNIALLMNAVEATGWIVNGFNANTISLNTFYIGAGIAAGRTDGTISNGIIIGGTQTLTCTTGSAGIKYSNVYEYNCSYGITLQDATDITIDNVETDYDTVTPLSRPFISTRAANTLSTDIKVKNCIHRAPIGYGMIYFDNSGGNVNNFLVENSYFEGHINGDTSEKTCIKHEETAVGDVTQFAYRNNTFKIIDDTAALTGADAVLSYFPANPSKLSYWENNKIIMEGLQYARFALPSLPNVKTTGNRYYDSLAALREDTSTTTPKLLHTAAIPTKGTWTAGDFLNNSATAASGIAGWLCYSSGTFGTLTGVTADTTATSATVTVNSATDLRIGQYISIAGVAGTKRITAMSGTTLTVDVVCDASVDDGAVAWVAPTFNILYGVRGNPAATQVIKWNAGGYAEWAADAT